MASPEGTEESLKATLADRYRIEREIGSGGMATVFLARDLKHDRDVALKVLKPELAAVVGADRFLAEIRTTAHLQHPNILPLFDSGEADGQLFYVMPYVEGESLRDRLNREKQLPVDEAIRIATDVAEALQAAHDDGVIHRDIKPANILIRKGKALVADFGIALAVSAAGGGRLTETGLSLGTPYYMSPEQASADRDPDARSDVYSTGCVLYEMLTGEPPFPGSTAQAVLARILTGDLVRPTERRKAIPANVEGALLKAIEKLPADRFSSARAFMEALGDPGFLHGGDVGPGGAGSPPSGFRRWVGYLGWGAATGLAAVLAFVSSRGLSGTGEIGHVSRYQILLPDTLPLTFQGPEIVWQSSLALSRDGQLLAYVAPTGGTTRLLLRNRASGIVMPLEGTEGAYSPFFSPDGQWVAFFTGDEIRKIPVSGGSTVPLGRYGGVGGAWTEDGRIFLASDEGREPAFLPEVGGDTAALGRLISSFRSPSLLPGDRWAAGVLWSGQLGLLSLETGELLAITRRGILPPDSVQPGDMLVGFDPQYVRSGHILFLSNGGGGLLALPFDPEKLEVLGEPVPVVGHVRKEAAYGFGHFAASDDGTLIYAPGLNAHRGHLVYLDGTGQVDTLPFPRNRYDYFQLSPDGGSLLTGQRDEEGGPSRIVRLYLQTGRGIRVVVDDTLSVLPGPWIDGSSILVQRFRPVTQEYLGIGEVPLSGGDYRAFTDRPLSWPVVHPDRNQVVASDFGSWEALLVTLDGSTEADLGIDGYYFSFSPDGRWLTYVNSESGGVVVTPFPLTGNIFPVADRPAEQPRWSTSGDALFYRAGGEFWRVPVSESGGELKFGEAELFARGPFVRVFSWSYAVMPDDRLLAVMGPSERSTGHLEVITNFFSVLEEKAPRRR
ncbi:protein kinase [Gemmatimonadota bacterium]